MPSDDEKIINTVIERANTISMRLLQDAMNGDNMKLFKEVAGIDGQGVLPWVVLTVLNTTNAILQFIEKQYGVDAQAMVDVIRLEDTARVEGLQS